MEEPQGFEWKFPCYTAQVDAEGRMSEPAFVAVEMMPLGSFDYDYSPEFSGSPAWMAVFTAFKVIRYGPNWRRILDSIRPVPLLWSFCLTALISAALAALCFRRQRRYGVPLAERIGWPLFVFLFGLPGWIGYRYCRRWPVLEECEACHVPAPRNTEACPACQRGFPLPAATGSEIFA